MYACSVLTLYARIFKCCKKFKPKKYLFPPHEIYHRNSLPHISTLNLSMKKMQCKIALCFVNN